MLKNLFWDISEYFEGILHNESKLSSFVVTEFLSEYESKMWSYINSNLKSES